MALDQRPVLTDRVRIDIVDNLHRMRVAHRHHRRLQGFVGDVEEMDDHVVVCQKGNLGRLETRLAHVDGDIAIAFETRLDDAAHRLDPDLALVGQPLLMHETDKTAGAVAALFNLAAIGIEDAITEIDTGLGRFFNEQNLVTADAKIAVSEITQLFRGEVDLLAHAIENDEIVAQAMHLGKLELHERLRI